MIIIAALALVLGAIIFGRLVVFFTPLIVIGWLTYDWFGVTLSVDSWMWVGFCFVVAAIVLPLLAAIAKSITTIRGAR